MAFIGQKKARDLILRWRYADLDEIEFLTVTGQTFHTAGRMAWNDFDHAEERIRQVRRDSQGGRGSDD